MINFKNEPNPYIGEFYLVDNPAADLGITEQTVFPVYLKVCWKKLEKCNGVYIKITSFMNK